MVYRPEIDGLRALAVLPVILFHAGLSGFSGGYVGVDVFFVISGFLITGILWGELQTQRYSIVRFYERRARRILPALAVVTLACVPFALAWMLPFQLADFGRSLLGVVGFVSNIVLWRQSGYFEGAAELKPLLHTWSLAVEEQYYVVFPLVLWLLRRQRRSVILAALTLCMLSSFALAEWAWWNYPSANFFLTPTRVWELMLGSWLALATDAAPPLTPADAPPASDAWMQAGGVLGLALLLAGIFGFDAHTPFPSRYTLVPTLGTALLLHCARPHTWVGQLLSSRVLVGVGLVSYSAYLWHQPLFAFARLHTGQALSGIMGGALSLAALALAWASWRFVERPFRQSQVVGRRAVALGSLLALSAMTAAGLWTVADNGRVSRYPEADRYLVGLNPDSMKWYANQVFSPHDLAPFRRVASASDASPAGGAKVFVVGDSYAQDVVNALHDTRSLERVLLSTHYIRKECGVAMTAQGHEAHIDPGVRQVCARRRPLDNPIFIERLQEADVVLLASSWREWEVDMLPDTLAHLAAAGARRVVVIGRKDFGTIEPLKYLRLTPGQRQVLRQPVNRSHTDINALMRQTLPEGTWVDQQTLICQQDLTCPVFTSDLRLLSFDGGHLTPEGAAWVGPLLAGHPLIRPWLNSD